jgi:hypothetical protein
VIEWTGWRSISCGRTGKSRLLPLALFPLAALLIGALPHQISRHEITIPSVTSMTTTCKTRGPDAPLMIQSFLSTPAATSTLIKPRTRHDSLDHGFETLWACHIWTMYV